MSWDRHRQTSFILISVTAELQNTVLVWSHSKAPSDSLWHAAVEWSSHNTYCLVWSLSVAVSCWSNVLFMYRSHLSAKTLINFPFWCLGLWSFHFDGIFCLHQMFIMFVLCTVVYGMTAIPVTVLLLTASWMTVLWKWLCDSHSVRVPLANDCYSNDFSMARLHSADCIQLPNGLPLLAA